MSVHTRRSIEGAFGGLTLLAMPDPHFLSHGFASTGAAADGIADGRTGPSGRTPPQPTAHRRHPAPRTRRPSRARDLPERPAGTQPVSRPRQPTARDCAGVVLAGHSLRADVAFLIEKESIVKEYCWDTRIEVRGDGCCGVGGVVWVVWFGLVRCGWCGVGWGVGVSGDSSSLIW
jgi:hypothetical protein